VFHHGRKERSLLTKSLKDLTAIVSPAEWLSNSKRQELLQKIIKCSGLDSDRFEQMGESLLYNVIDHCQSLPETANSYYSLPGGLFDYALNRTEAALTLFRQYIVKEEGVELTEEQKLWVYALFSAGLLQGIGKLQIDYRVDLYDANGQLLKQWAPLLESMESVGQHYCFEFQAEGEDDLRRRLNLLMARVLMPTSGYSWIISNRQVLAVWLALLNEDPSSAGTLGAILIRADAIAIQRYMSDFMVKGMDGRGGRVRIGTFVDGVPESLAEREHLIGVEFILWLMSQLEMGKVFINKAPLLMVPGGLLMCADIFKLFIREHPEFKNWQAVQQSFLSLGLHRVGADGSPISRFEPPNSKQMESGVVFSEYAIALPEQMKRYEPSTGNISTISATELVHLNISGSKQQSLGINLSVMPHLSGSGEWQSAQQNNSSLASGHKHSG
jgi:integrating conjugative element relaxase (TIGR03760 family)